MLLSDREIRKLCVECPLDKEIRRQCPGIPEFRPMLAPFSEAVSGGGVIGYGLSSCGYDIRLAPGVRVFKNTAGVEVDPKRFKESGYADLLFDTIVARRVVIPAHGYVLGGSVEYFRMPPDVAGRCMGKSTYARVGVTINVTPLEPGWEGYLTIEIENANPCPAVIYADEGIAQILFERVSEKPEKTYADKGGKYQRQDRVTNAIVQ